MRNTSIKRLYETLASSSPLAR